MPSCNFFQAQALFWLLHLILSHKYFINGLRTESFYRAKRAEFKFIKHIICPGFRSQWCLREKNELIGDHLPSRKTTLSQKTDERNPADILLETDFKKRLVASEESKGEILQPTAKVLLSKQRKMKILSRMLGVFPFLAVMGFRSPAHAYFSFEKPQSAEEARTQKIIYGSIFVGGSLKVLVSRQREKRRVKRETEKKLAMEKEFLNVQGKAETDEDIQTSLKERMDKIRQIRMDKQKSEQAKKEKQIKPKETEKKTEDIDLLSDE